MVPNRATHHSVNTHSRNVTVFTDKPLVNQGKGKNDHDFDVPSLLCCNDQLDMYRRFEYTLGYF